MGGMEGGVQVPEVIFGGAIRLNSYIIYYPLSFIHLAYL